MQLTYFPYSFAKLKLKPETNLLWRIPSNLLHSVASKIEPKTKASLWESEIVMKIDFLAAGQTNFACFLVLPWLLRALLLFRLQWWGRAMESCVGASILRILNEKQQNRYHLTGHLVLIKSWLQLPQADHSLLTALSLASLGSLVAILWGILVLLWWN